MHGDILRIVYWIIRVIITDNIDYKFQANIL